MPIVSGQVEKSSLLPILTVKGPQSTGEDSDCPVGVWETVIACVFADRAAVAMTVNFPSPPQTA